MIVESDGKVYSNGNESIIAMALAMCSQKYGEECLEILDRISDDWEVESQSNKVFDWLFVML